MKIDNVKFEDILRRVVHEEVPVIVRDTIHAEVPSMIRDETADMRQDVADMKDMLGAQGMRLNLMYSEVTHLTDAMRYQATETHRLDILLEDLNDRFAAARELHWD